MSKPLRRSCRRGATKGVDNVACPHCNCQQSLRGERSKRKCRSSTLRRVGFGSVLSGGPTDQECVPDAVSILTILQDSPVSVLCSLMTHDRMLATGIFTECTPQCHSDWYPFKACDHRAHMTIWHCLEMLLHFLVNSLSLFPRWPFHTSSALQPPPLRHQENRSHDQRRPHLLSIKPWASQQAGSVDGATTCPGLPGTGRGERPWDR